MEQNIIFPNIPHEQFQEILNKLKSLSLLVCETHEEKKLIYSFVTKEFKCPSCFLKTGNLDKSAGQVIDLKLFLSKSYLKWLLSSLSQSLSTQNSKTHSSLYRNLQNFLSDFKVSLKKTYEDLISTLKTDYEKASEDIDHIVMKLNLDSLVMRSEEAMKVLNDSLNSSHNLINLETFSKITDIKEILDNLNEINDPLFEDMSALMKFQLEKKEYLENLASQTKRSISGLFSLELDFAKIRANYNLALKSIVLKENMKNLKSNMYYGNVLMDSKNLFSTAVYCYPDYINISAFYHFESLEKFKHFNGQQKILPCNICGVYNLVFNGFLYARKEPYMTSNTIVRINLESLKIENERALEDFLPQEIIQGWSLYNIHFFVANKEDIFLIYGSNYKDCLQTLKINPITLETERKYDIGLKKMGFDAIFFDGRSINVVQGNKVSFKYNLYRESREEMNVEFKSPYSHYNLYYCAQEKSLWALYPKNMSIFELKF